MSTETNTQTASFATERRALPLRQLALIGVAGTDDARRALLRTPAGQIRQVQVGDVLRQGTVMAIAADAITFAGTSGRTTVLQMPAQADLRPAA
ncbi:pilus assembly protein PilP [uncultured Tateyamaria sp.]|uniref:pilus assembly protein PilP n=1 Tax=Tateyamaria sp. 1078 TaxID=3417464 RepID=UPI002625B090|nr:pilus assembly protein PilP [uncultured Tateyamaria sp.]